MNAPSINETGSVNTLILARIVLGMSRIKRTLVFTPGTDKALPLDPQGISNPIDIIEVADYLRGIMDGDIIQPDLAQGLDVSFAHIRGLNGQLLGIGAQSAVNPIQRRSPPVSRQRMDKGIRRGFAVKSFDLSPEVMGMRLYSVMAVIGSADDHRQHLALGPRQGRMSEHGRAVHLHRGFHHPPVERHNLHDIPDAPRAFDSFFQFFFEQPARLVDGYLLDIRHKTALSNAPNK